MSHLKMTFQDHDGDEESTSIRTYDPPDATDYATWRTALVQLSIAVDSLCLGRQSKHVHVIMEADNGPGAATSVVAQKTTRLVLVTQDLVNLQTYIERIPMADLTRADDAGPPVVPPWIVTGTGKHKVTSLNPEHTLFALLKASYDVVGRSPNDNPAILLSAHIDEGKRRG